MKKLKIIIIAVLFFILGSGTSAIFVSNVLNMKLHRLMKGYSHRSAEKQQEQEEYRLVLKLKEIEFDSTGLEGVNAFNASVYENEIIGKVWSDYHDELTAIIEDSLKKEGLHIVHKLNDATPDFISLAINVVRDEPSRTIAGSIELYLSGAFVNYQTKKFVSANRWNKTRAFMIKETEAAEYLEEITRSLMNDFIKDYIKANPKKEGAVSFGATSQ